MHRKTDFLVLVFIVLFQVQFTISQSYDLVILNGRVMDPESMLDATLNVGVKDGIIAIITESEIKGKKPLMLLVMWLLLVL